MFFNNLKSKLYTNFHNLADAKTCKIRHSFQGWCSPVSKSVNQLTFRFLGVQHFTQLAKLLALYISASFLWCCCDKRKRIDLVLHNRAKRHLLSFCVPCSSLSLRHPQYLGCAGSTLSGYLSNCTKLSILKSSRIFYSSVLFKQCTAFLVHATYFVQTSNLMICI